MTFLLLKKKEIYDTMIAGSKVINIVNENRVKIDSNNPAIQRIEERCVNCGVCLNVCANEVGLDRQCRVSDGQSCIYCGQCILSCPMGALKEKYDYKKVLDLIKDTDQLVAISIAPAVRVSLGEEFDFEVGTSMESILPAILKSLGFSFVFDVTFGADVTIVEEANELVDRIKNGGAIPMFSSCCPAWVKYVKDNHPELIPNLSTTKSPIGIMSSLIKTYFKEMNDIEEDIVSVVVAPCTAKKCEILDGDTDYVITTRELALMIKEARLDIDGLKKKPMDSLLGHGSKSGLLFGRSGGVMEATLSQAHYILTEIPVREGEFRIEGSEPIREASFKMGDKILNVVVVYGLSNLEKILPSKEKYDFIEVMNCPDGCIGGGGGPLTSKMEIEERRQKRSECMAEQKNEATFPYENENVKELYRSYLIKPGGNLASKILHIEHIPCDIDSEK